MNDALRRFAPSRTRALMTRILDEPRLLPAVRALPASALAALVREIGLEDAGEIVSLASPEQLARVLDEDVWRSARRGGDEALDAQRFAVWLEVLAEAGAEVAAQKVLELPDELVLHGLARLVLVVDLDRLGEAMSALDDDDADQVDKALADAPHLEIDGWRVVAREHDGWDAIVEVLLALDGAHRADLERILERLAFASGELHDDPAQLHRVLSEAETLAEDAAADRERRRAAEGYVAAADARAFLRLARAATFTAVRDDAQRDPVTRAWLRELAPASKPAPLPREAAALLAAIGAGEAAPQRAGRGRLSAGTATPRDARAGAARRAAAFQAALRALASSDPLVHAQRLDELAFLVNVLLAAGVVPRPAAAAERVAEICGRGLSRWRRDARTRGAPLASAALLREVPADRLFRAGLSQRS
jgi:hypothetical protein